MQQEEWQEAESVQAKTIQPEPEQQQPVQSPVPESTPNPSPDPVLISPPTEPAQQVEESDNDDGHEPSLFDILDDDADEDPEDDVPENQLA